MKKALLKFPLKIGIQTYPAGTAVKVLGSEDSRVRRIWPGMKEQAGSEQVALELPGRATPIIHVAKGITETVDT